MEEAMGIDMQTILEVMAGTLSTYGLRVVGALVVLLLGRMIAGMARTGAGRAMRRSRLEPTIIPFISGLVYYGLLAFVILAVLRLFGIETTSFIAVLGAAGFAVGLAMQGTLSNFSAGFMVLWFRPFKVGDYVQAGGISGTVVEIGVFTTTLHSPDNVQILVPNSSIYGQTIRNYSVNDTRRIDLVMGIAYTDDIGKAIAVIRKVLDSDNRVLGDPAPVIAVDELADSSVNLVVRPWCRRENYGPLRWDLTRRLKEDLEAAGCSIPFPQRDVHVHQPGTPQAV